MSIDNSKVDSVLKALKECNEVEIEVVFGIWTRLHASSTAPLLKRGPGRPKKVDNSTGCTNDPGLNLVLGDPA